MTNDLVVLKFGSSVLRTRADLPCAVHEIYRWYRAGQAVIAVVSAIGDTTEELLTHARELASDAEAYATAELLATGERNAAALLGIALDRVGVPARILDPREVQLLAAGAALDSDPVAVRTEKLQKLLEITPVLVLPGFFGHDSVGRTHLFGRGGSDLTAVFLSTALRAGRCRLLKDVDGVYESDPATSAGARPHRYARLSYGDALRVAAPLIQPKAVQLLQRFGCEAEIASLAQPHASVVGAHGAAFEDSPARARTRVVLLGLGTVGFGVYQRLLAHREHFEIVGILIRDPAKHLANGVPPALLHTRHQTFTHVPADVVVDVLADDDLSLRLAQLFIASGIPVITACKSLVADAGRTLAKLGNEVGATLRYSAAVGGSAPMLEAVDRAVLRGEIESICGVLNGTGNFLIERCKAGATFAEALGEAQSRGLAEVDPTEDLSGRDSARKLAILARHAFGQELWNADVEIEPLCAESVAGNLAACTATASLRYVCRAWRDGARLFGRVQLEAVDAANPLARARGDWNALLITHTNGAVHQVLGRGAGRWPTAEAIVADLLAQRWAEAETSLGGLAVHVEHAGPRHSGNV